MKLNTKGFTLIELLTIIAIIAVLSALALPDIHAWIEDANYRSAVREIAHQLNIARSESVSKNLQYRVKFIMANNSFGIQIGDRASNSNWPAAGDPLVNHVFLPNVVALRYPGTCDNSTDDQYISFNPSGSSDSLYICVVEAANPARPRWRVGVPIGTTGRVVIQRRFNGAWE